MGLNQVPAKTPHGVAELASRALGLSQRHRTALLLVDGRRPLGQVLQLAEAAGVPGSVFEDLVALGLVAHTAAPDADAEADHIDLPLEPEGTVAEARAILARLLRDEAPVSGSLLQLKLRRAGSGLELLGLLDDVEQRLQRSRRPAQVLQSLQHVRQLLWAAGMAPARGG